MNKLQGVLKTLQEKQNKEAKKTKNNMATRKYSTYSQITNLISISKGIGLNSISVCLWDESYKNILPGLYCSDLEDISATIKSLSQHMDIRLNRRYIYIDDKISGIPKDCIERYIPTIIVEIYNIQNIRYFGVNAERYRKIEFLFDKPSKLMEEHLVKQLENKNTVNLSKSYINENDTFQKKNLFLILLLAIGNLNEKGYNLSITHTKDTALAINDMFMVNIEKKMKRSVFHICNDIALVEKNAIETK